MKNAHTIVVKPHITERSVALSYGDPRIQDEKEIVRKYTFIVNIDANKLEIKQAIEAIYNEGKKKNELIEVTSVRTMRIAGKTKRRGRFVGTRPERKKAIITLAKGHVLEDYGI
ncbi:MAG: 50S ribosomal protein L23 [Armatimonadetes bacterium]|nr:50S ribosomal protein L23 [Armatimonadota bacterium]